MNSMTNSYLKLVFCAHPHPSSSWHVKIKTDAQLAMMLMGMQYAKPAPGMGVTIKYHWTSISSSELFKLGQYTKNLEELEMNLKPNILSQSEFFECMPEYCPILSYEGSQKDYKGLVAVLSKLVVLTNLEIFFSSEDPFDQLKQLSSPCTEDL